MLTPPHGARQHPPHAKFEWSVNMILHHDDVRARSESIIGGASLGSWAARQQRVQGVAKSSPSCPPEIRWIWAYRTSYVPSPWSAYELTLKAGYLRKNPGADIAIKQLTNKRATANSKGLRFGNYVQRREVIEERSRP